MLKLLNVNEKRFASIRVTIAHEQYLAGHRIRTQWAVGVPILHLSITHAS